MGKSDFKYDTLDKMKKWLDNFEEAVYLFEKSETFLEENLNLTNMQNQLAICQSIINAYCKEKAALLLKESVEGNCVDFEHGFVLGMLNAAMMQAQDDEEK